MEVQSIFQEDVENVSKRLSSFVTESADILQQIAKQGDWQIALQLVYFLAYAPFEINIVEQYIKVFADDEEFYSGITRTILKDNELVESWWERFVPKKTVTAQYT